MGIWKVDQSIFNVRYIYEKCMCWAQQKTNEHNSTHFAFTTMNLNSFTRSIDENEKDKGTNEAV